MPLDGRLIDILAQSVKGYDFPPVTFDFPHNVEQQHDSPRGVEACIRDSLLSKDTEVVKDGLSNVLYWGYARMGYRNVRVNRFRHQVTGNQLLDAQQLFRRLVGPGLIQIKRLRLPEFGGLSFVSKVRMFLDPTNFVTLDLQLMKLRNEKQPTIFNQIRLRQDATTISITRENEMFYERWCSLCRRIAAIYFGNPDVRAVEIERAIYYLVSTDQAGLAAEILGNA